MRLRLSPVLLFVLSMGLLTGLSACDRQDATTFQQSGVWDITRVTATLYDSAGTVTSVETVTDAGQVAFLATGSRPGTDDLPASSNPEVRFYLDKSIPYGGPISLLITAGGSILEWYVDKYERRRISLGAPQLLGTVFVSYTLIQDDADYQEWESVTPYPNNVIRRREVWQVRRTK